MDEATTAVIFDCDGVLVDSETLALQIELKHLAELGLIYEHAEYKRRFLGGTRQAHKEGVLRDAIERTGRPPPDDFHERVGKALRAAYEADLTALPGARELISSLSVPKAVASSPLMASLIWKLKSAFGTHVYSSEQVTRGKPAPDLFLFAADRLGANPATTLVIEDSVNGIKAAKAAGMIAAGFTGGGHCDIDHSEMLLSAGADHVFASFAALGSHLASRNG